MFSPFWNGFLVGAVLFSMIGVAAGIFVVALCQASAKGNGTNDNNKCKQGEIVLAENTSLLKMQKKSLILFTLVLFLTGAFCLLQSGTGEAAKKKAAAPIGIVNYNALLDQHPDMAKAIEELKRENEQAQQEFESKSSGLSDKEKQDLDWQLRQRLELKQQELLNAIAVQIDAVIKEIADAQGLSAVVDQEATIYGGKDITNDVLKKIQKR
ncbi:OmpH family outer membrane protein [Sporomusa sphaeroides]|jgi:outer membrane protein|uniref:OmpH family outer membrane protein n=1 Tax=Sporomusa sphaeroides TaxID=47679 RepID=UPI002D18A523|nr:OmpH family outer membrane protein [Sporomusa sphaeroides]HML31791.1 OmpH family outer membrane protein [Sporomusa sphaeroides]